MKCKICNKNFFINRRLKDLFKIKEYYVCDTCYKKYPIRINYDVIPLGTYNLKIYSLFDKHYYLKNDPFIQEFSSLLEYVLNENNNVFVYYNLFLNDFNLKQFEIMSNLIENDIIIVCDYHEIK